MMMGPDPMIRIFLMSVRLGISYGRILELRSRVFHHRDEIIEQIARVVWPGRSLRMILHAKEWQRSMPHSLVCVIVQIHVGDLHIARGKRIWIYAKPMILRSNLHPLREQILYRVICPMMPELQLKRL